MKVVLLGTGGGPRPSPYRFPTSQVVVLGDRLIVVDCGNGVARQLAAAGLNPRNMSELLLTHHHVDHSADLGYLPLVSWIEGRTDKVSVYGPTPTIGAMQSILDGYEEDLIKRTESTGRPPFRPMLEVHDISKPGVVFEDDEVKVTTAFVDHPPFEVALGFRVDAGGKSVVFSGDTAPSPNLIELAQGADVLVHEVVHPLALSGLSESTNAATIVAHMSRNHTMVADIAGVAEAAGVRKLILSHLVPHELPDTEWIDAVGSGFSGEVVVGRDLMEIEL